MVNRIVNFKCVKRTAQCENLQCH